LFAVSAGGGVAGCQKTGRIRLCSPRSAFFSLSNRSVALRKVSNSHVPHADLLSFQHKFKFHSLVCSGGEFPEIFLAARNASPCRINECFHLYWHFFVIMCIFFL
jgi:hypothetical protein